MAKKEEVQEVAAGVTVRLSCILSGFAGEPGPGAVITVHADEAARLIDLGVATEHTLEVAPEGDGKTA